MTTKFKVGDAVTPNCKIHQSITELKEGGVYFIEGVVDDGVRLKGLKSTYVAHRFDLVKSEFLTPEEIFKALKDDVPLQWLNSEGKWLDDNDSLGNSVRDICEFQWRYKPQPEIITLNGKRYKEIVDE